MNDELRAMIRTARIAALQRGRAAKRAQNKEQESGPTPLRDK